MARPELCRACADNSGKCVGHETAPCWVRQAIWDDGAAYARANDPVLRLIGHERFRFLQRVSTARPEQRYVVELEDGHTFQLFCGPTPREAVAKAWTWLTEQEGDHGE